jgi:uncharacterized repeat protein (TIGR01451 family)
MAQFTNQAQLTYNGVTVNSNIALGEITEVLAVTKTALSDNYGRDDRITYLISIINSGNVPFTSLTVTDDLGAYPFGGGVLYPLSYREGSARLLINGQLQADPTVTAGPPLAFSGITVPANSNAVIIYETSVTAAAPLNIGSSVTNTVIISGSGLSSSLTDSETVTVDTAPDLTITKTIEPVPVAENGQVTYTFIIQNRGNTPAVATDDVVLRDNFDPTLSAITVTLNGTTLSEGTSYTYNESTGVLATVPGVITVPAATYTQNAETGLWEIEPGVTTLVITGTIYATISILF